MHSHNFKRYCTQIMNELVSNNAILNNPWQNGKGKGERGTKGMRSLPWRSHPAKTYIKHLKSNHISESLECHQNLEKIYIYMSYLPPRLLFNALKSHGFDFWDSSIQHLWNLQNQHCQTCFTMVMNLLRGTWNNGNMMLTFY